MVLSIYEESDDQIGESHMLTKPALAPEADIVTTGATVLESL